MLVVSLHPISVYWMTSIFLSLAALFFRLSMGLVHLSGWLGCH